MKKVSIILVLLAFAATAFGQSPAASAPITEFEVNGLKVILKRRPTSPTVAVGLFVRGGAANQTVDKAGLESITLDTASEGSVKFPRAVLRKELSRMGSSIGAGSNYDYSAISLASTREHFGRTWEIFTDVVKNPTFTQADFDQVRDRTLTGLRNRGASPDDALNNLEAEILYAGHPYAADPSGTVETIGKFTVADLKAYHKSLLETSRLLLVAVGDIDEATLKDLVTKAFGTMPRGNYTSKPLPKLTFTEATINVSQRTLPTDYVKGVFAAPSPADPDYYAMRVAMTLLQSRVYQEVRVRRNLSYAPNAEMGGLAANTGNIYVTSTDANQSIRIMLNEIEKMKAGDVDPDSFMGLAGYFLTTYYLAQETNAAQAAELGKYELIGGGWRRSLDFIPGMHKVTAEEVRAAANKYMKNIRFFVVGKPQALDRATIAGR
ncbi:MAG: pitrilysin family protein [Pyrinomonadaceae bacterium]|nr:pitrilysin family protein [Pyrinomonadaceae bacterium]